MALAFDYFKGGVHDGTSDLPRRRRNWRSLAARFAERAEFISSIGRVQAAPGKTHGDRSLFKKAVIPRSE